ncbi:MAG: acyl--CoA ligase [Bacteriovorax sp.]|nr:acyl--CoA ligase [Bacteriovorax sp.]
MKNSILDRFNYSFQSFKEDVFLVEAESEKSFTYEKFFNDTVRICYFLELNFTDIKIIVLIGKNSYLYSVYLMATILSGKTLFPINPDEDQKVILNSLKKLDKKYAIFADRALELSISNINLIEALSHLPVPKEFMPKGPEPYQDLVYISTSATTGESKIVIQKEIALLSNIDDLIEHHKLLDRKKIATPLPLFHVNALHFSFFCTLFSGGQLVIFKNYDPRRCFEFIEKKEIDILSIIPALLTNIIQNYYVLKNFNISSLKYFVSAAAPLSVESVKEIKKLYGKNIIQGYGLSEAINFSCTLPINISEEMYRKVMTGEKFPSIGIELKCNEIIIVDEDFKKVAEGIEGELAIKGSNLMSGYLNTPAGSGFNGKYFLTGDLGYFKTYENQNYFFISGRKKEIAKVLGETISLRELDELIRAGNIVKNDFFAVAFDNLYKGEEIGVICKIERIEEINDLTEKFQICFKDIKKNKRPKVVLFITSQNVRTPSGKAKRAFFKDYFSEFFGKRFLGQTEFKVV